MAVGAAGVAAVGAAFSAVASSFFAGTTSSPFAGAEDDSSTFEGAGGAGAGLGAVAMGVGASFFAITGVVSEGWLEAIGAAATGVEFAGAGVGFGVATAIWF